jgi:hypothetical protein
VNTSPRCGGCGIALVGRCRPWRCESPPAQSSTCPDHSPEYCTDCTVAHDWTCPGCGTELTRRPHRTTRARAAARRAAYRQMQPT